jgi:aminopeptidase N
MVFGFLSFTSILILHSNHKPVTSDDLYKAFETIISRSGSADFDFTTAFKSWENQKGYPVIHVSVDETTRMFTVSQERYLQASEERVANDPSSWYIPLNFASASDPSFETTKFTHFMENGSKTKTISAPANFDYNKWFVFNKQQIGYYRVNYDFANWHELIKVLNSDNFKQIHVLNRAQLIDDSLNFAADGYLDYQTALGILQYLSRETDYIPWKAAANNLERLDYILAGRPPHDDFKKFVMTLARRLSVTLGTEEKSDDSLMDRFARELVMDWMCRLGDEKCLAQTKEKAVKLAMENAAVPASLEIVTICHGLKGLNHEEEFKKLFQRMQASNDQAERLRLIDGLLCSTNPAKLLNFLQSTLFDTESVSYKTHERQRILNNVYTKSSIGAETLIQFIDEDFDDIVEIFSVGEVEGVITGMSKRISLYEDQVRITDLIDKLQGKINANVKTTSLKNIDDNKVWHEGQKYFDSVVFISNFIEKSEEFENQLRLPRTSIPEGYQLHIDARNIQTGNLDFSGQVEIYSTVMEATDRILIHSRAHKIEELKVLDRITLDEIPLLHYNQFAPTDTLAIYFMESLPKDQKIMIHIKYSAKLLTNVGYGFHQTFYDIDGKRRYLGATNFESSVSTRHAFPHYDEPGFKAVFELKITHDASLGAISNTMGIDASK